MSSVELLDDEILTASKPKILNSAVAIEGKSVNYESKIDENCKYGLCNDDTFRINIDIFLIMHIFQKFA